MIRNSEPVRLRRRRRPGARLQDRHLCQRGRASGADQPQVRPEEGADPGQEGALTPAVYGAVDGDCGDSWINTRKTSTHHVEIESGFDITEWAIAYSWVVSLTDENGSSRQTASGTLDYDTSREHLRTGLTQYDYTIDQVLTSSSAVLWNGSVCYSGGPYVVLDGLDS